MHHPRLSPNLFVRVYQFIVDVTQDGLRWLEMKKNTSRPAERLNVSIEMARRRRCDAVYQLTFRACPSYQRSRTVGILDSIHSLQIVFVPSPSRLKS
jgi:hypothetical protein